MDKWLLFLVGIAIGFSARGLVTKVYAHSFYDASCCNDRDCAPLAPEQVQVTPNGYVLPNGQTVPFGQERVSPDKDYHWCRYPGTQPLVHPYNERVCFYAPAQGS